MPTRISADEISQRLSKIESESLPQGTPAYVELKITLSSEGVSLEYDAGKEELRIVNADPAQEEILRECLRQANVLPVGMQLHTAMLKPWSEKYFNVETLGKWLLDVANAWLASSAYLIPDTNFLIRRYGSNLVVELTRRFKDFHLYIPRLAILEIESLPRQEKKKGSQNEKWAKRRAFSAFAELIRLRETGAELLPQQIEPRVMQSFSEIAGSGYTDAWIRREVHDFLEKLTNEKTQEHKAKAFFLTSDLLNAFAAIAEGIDTLYLWESSDKDGSYEANYEKLGKFIVAMSVFFERVSMQIQSSKTTESYELTGVWSGKTIEDWKKDLVEMSKKA